MLRQSVISAGRKMLGSTFRLQERSLASKATSVDIDWDKIGSMVQSEEGKRELASLRNTMLELERTVGQFESSKGQQPDWSSWKKKLDATIVEKFEKALESTKVPAFEDKDIAQVKERFASIAQQAEALSMASAERVKAIDQELAGIASEKQKLRTVTVDEELANNPDLAKEIDSSNEKNSFLVS